MSERAYSAGELVGLPGMPAKSTRSIYLFEAARGMVRQPGSRPVRWVYTSLPAETRAALDARLAATERPSEAPAPDEAPAPAPDETAAQAPAARRHASDRDRVVADARLEVLHALERWRRAEGETNLNRAAYRFCDLYNGGSIEIDTATRAALPRLSRTRLMEWRRAQRTGGWSALLPRRGGHNAGAGVIDRDTEMRDAIIAHILERPGHVNARTIMRALRVAFQHDRPPSYRTLQRWIAAWLEENRRLVSAVADPDRHRSKYLPAAGDAAAGITRLNQLWELDSTPADAMCTDGRHAIVAAIDVFSRRAKVLVVPTSRAAAIAALLRRAILAWGVPETVRTDEGSDYTSRHVRRALADLRVEHEVLPPYQPQMKPFIERFMRTLSHGLIEQLPGFAGHSVAEAQALRNRKAFAARRGEGDAEAFGVKMTAAELQAACDDWLDTVYEREPHAGLGGLSPFEAAAGRPVRTIDDERALDLLLAEPAGGDGWRVVQKKGIHAQGTTFIAGPLGALVGERVHVKLDPADAGGIYVFDRDGLFLCRAVAPEREGIDPREIAAEMKAAARAADAEARAYARAKKREVKPEQAIGRILAAGRAETTQIVAFPGRSTEHDSPGLAAAREASAADEVEPIEAVPDASELEFMRRLSARQEREAEERRREEEELRAIAAEAGRAAGAE